MTVRNINVTFQFIFVQKTKASENKNDCYYLFEFVCVLYINAFFCFNQNLMDFKTF